MTVREIERMLIENGWFPVNQVGSHKHYRHPVKPGKVTVPFKRGDLDKGTANSILKLAGLKQTGKEKG